MVHQKFWQDKKVLVTGHTGFKGSWLSLWLQSMGANVVGYALETPSQPSLFEIANVADGMTSITGDTRDLEHFVAVFKEHRPEIVIHLAAQPIVRYSYQNPVETYATNVMGTVNMLEAVRQTDSTRVVVSITSDKCYENREWYWGYRENEAMGGHDPYSSSKGCAELIISAYRNSYFPLESFQDHGVAVASTRAGNVIGGGDWASDRLVPDIMRAVLANEPVIIRNPQATRPWQHVLEPLHGYLCLAEALWHNGEKFAEAWNFGPGDEDAKPVKWIVNYLTNSWGNNARWELDNSQDHPHENTYLKLNCSKAKSLLKWSPKTNISTALDWIVEWFQGYKKGKNMRSLTELQINRYQKMEGYLPILMGVFGQTFLNSVIYFA